MKKRSYRKALIAAVIFVCAITYLIINGSRKTVAVAFEEYEDKLGFKGFYFIEEHVLYTGDMEEISLKYKNGDLVPKGVSIADNIITNEAGMLITHIDGYENKYNRENIKNITPEEIDKIVSNEKINSGIKIVNNSQWYVCALLDDYDEKYLKKGISKDVSINNKYFNADIIDVYKNNNSVIVLLRFKNDLDVKSLSRGIKGYIVKSKYAGIVVPQNSIIDYNGSKGVFINLNGYAEFRAIKVIKTLKDSAIVIPDKDAKPKLQEYDEIICNPKGLNSGKKIR